MSESVITIKSARGLPGDEFTARNGNELVRVKIPNEDPKDHSPWASFVVPVGSVYDSQNGKAVCVDLPADGETTVTESHRTGTGADGRGLWERIPAPPSAICVRKPMMFTAAGFLSMSGV